MSEEIRITELDVPSPRSFVFRGDDLPHAEERATAAFESGGKLVKERIDLPGRGAPIFHVHAAPERPLTIKGAFRDWLTTEGHARDARDALLDLWRRANLLRLVWGSQERTVLLDEPKFGEESKYSITYELTFEVAVAPDATFAEIVPEFRQASDLAEVLAARLRARRAALARTTLDRGALGEMLAALDSGIAALGDVQREIDGLEKTVNSVGARVRRVLSVAQRAQNILSSAQRLYARTVAQGDLTVRSVTSVTDVWRAQFGGASDVLDVLDALRSVRQQARRRANAGGRLYRVKPGDTLESVAQATLGSAARAGELGVRADELTPGRFLRVPGAS